MERTLISWNVPNLITIWLMLFLGLLVFALISQSGFRLPIPGFGANSSASPPPGLGGG